MEFTNNRVEFRFESPATIMSDVDEFYEEFVEELGKAMEDMDTEREIQGVVLSVGDSSSFDYYVGRTKTTIDVPITVRFDDFYERFPTEDTFVHALEEIIDSYLPNVEMWLKEACKHTKFGVLPNANVVYMEDRLFVEWECGQEKMELNPERVDIYRSNIYSEAYGVASDIYADIIYGDKK